MKRPRENESISDQDLRHVFDKVDINRDERVNRRVSKGWGRAFFYVFVHSMCRSYGWLASFYANSLVLILRR